MTENNNDERLLEQFFRQARAMEVADEGFTERVMRRLPERSLRLSRLWTAGCVAVGLVLFTLFGGWQMLLAWGLRLLTTMPTTGQVAQVWICLLVVTVLGISEVFRRESRLGLL